MWWRGFLNQLALFWKGHFVVMCLPAVDDHVPRDLKDKTLADWAHLWVDNPAPPYDSKEQEINAVEQVALTVWGDHGAAFDDTNSNSEGKGGRGAGYQQKTNVTMLSYLIGEQSRLLSMRQENLELKNAFNAMKGTWSKSLSWWTEISDNL